MAKKVKKEKKEKGKKTKKREKAPKEPRFAYDRAVSTLGGAVCLYAVFIIAAIVFSVLYAVLLS